MVLEKKEVYEFTPWNEYTPAPNPNDMDRIVNFPDEAFDEIDKIKPAVIADWCANANFRDDEHRKNSVLLLDLCLKYRARRALILVLIDIGSTIGVKALGKVLKLQTGTKLVVPRLMSDQLSLGRIRKGKEDNKDEVYRGSDFKPENKDKPSEL